MDEMLLGLITARDSELSCHSGAQCALGPMISAARQHSLSQSLSVPSCTALAKAATLHLGKPRSHALHPTCRLATYQPWRSAVFKRCSSSHHIVASREAQRCHHNLLRTALRPVRPGTTAHSGYVLHRYSVIRHLNGLTRNARHPQPRVDSTGRQCCR
eukprot:1589339-Rhodomonas_salina.1